MRYQSDEITWVLHVIFLVDLAVVVRFNWQVFGGGPRIWWDRLAVGPVAAWRRRLVAVGSTLLHLIGLVWVG